jgi:peptidoglycan/xylan/chitin deacetylase (PgdA/CDA1 family)
MSKHQWSYIVFGLFTLIYVFYYINNGWSIGYFLLGVICWLLLLVYGSFFIQSNYHIKAISSVNTDKKIVAITFDDGPTLYTPAVLEALKKHQAYATFFCIGKNVEMYPDIFQAILDGNHTVGNHTYSHSNQMGFKSTKKIIEELNKTDDLIQSYTKQKPTLFRPPFGVTNPSIMRAVNKTNHKVIGWSIRSLDTVLKNETNVFNRIKRQIQPGSIILLHDTSELTVRVLERLLTHLDAISYKSVTIEKLLKE